MMLIRYHTLLLLVLASIVLYFFFSYKILEVPSGLTSDESAFGFNAALLSKTAHDENGRFMPVFVLSIHGSDWRQPVTQYYLTGLFKIFGPSVYLLRVSSVLITIVCFWMIYHLASELLNKKMAILASVVFLTTPLIMIQSHFGLDNIMTIPFTLMFIIGIYHYRQTFKLRYLFLAAVGLGIGFYTYKGMRAFVPAWIILSSLYIFWVVLKKYSFKKALRVIIFYGLFLLPYFAIIPLLEWKYAHAVFGTQTTEFKSIYEFLYPYFSSYDPTFLFIKGDELLHHSTQKHGMLLLATMPLFFIGVYQAIQKKNFWLFLTLVFFTGPLFYGLVGSVHRASRLMALIPSYTLIVTFGGYYLLQQKDKLKRYLFLVILFLMVINYADFITYYWTPYAQLTESIFGNLSPYQDIKVFAQESQKRNLTPYLSSQIYTADGFYSASYFDTPPVQLAGDDIPPKGTLFLSPRKEIPGLKNLNAGLPHYNIFLHE